MGTVLSKRNRDMGEIRDRNIEQHWEGHSVNTEFHMPIYFKRGREKATDLIKMTQGIDLKSLTLVPGGADPLHPKY